MVIIDTCHLGGLKVESVHGTTFGLHRILVCDPQMGALRS